MIVRLLLTLLVGALVVSTAWELASRLGLICNFDHSLGVYVVLAELARQGVLYPPQPSHDLLYCTLYQPLGFLPYALLPGSGAELIAAMRALVRVEVALAVAAVIFLLHRCRPGVVAAAVAALLLLCATPVTAASLTCIDDPRGFLLAALAFVVFTGRDGRLHPWRAGPLFALAFFTKLTAPCAAGVAALFACRSRPLEPGKGSASQGRTQGGRVGAVLLLSCLLWTAAGYALAHGVAGWDLAGNGLGYALFDAKPGRPLGEHVGHFARDVLAREPVTALLLAGGAAAAIIRFARRRGDAFDVWLVAAMVRALVEYKSHGTELNHLFEPCLLGAVAVARLLHGPWAPWVGLVAVPVAFFAGRPVLRVSCDDRTPLAQSPHLTAATALRLLPVVPTLCESPLLAWLSGSRPIVTDPFLVSSAWRRYPEVRAAWFGPPSDPRALRRLVLLVDPDRDPSRAANWYGNLHFDAQFLADVRRSFVLALPSDYGTVFDRR